MAMTRIPPDFKEFLRLLKVHDVRYLLVGGYAVNAFGYVRNTVDMDVWIASTPDNQDRVIDAIREFGFAGVSRDVLADANSMLRMGNPPLRIEVLKSLSGVEFEECWDRRVELPFDELVIPVIALDDLKVNKRAAARPKDLVDLSQLP